MKRILYLFVVAVLLTACSSENGIRTYNKGTKYYYGESMTELISKEDFNEELKVLVENDTVWFYSNVFDKNSNAIALYSLVFEDKDTSKDKIILSIDKYSSKEYYCVLKLGKFFDFNSIKEIYCSFGELIIHDFRTSDYNTTTEEIRYILDKDQFKHLRK